MMLCVYHTTKSQLATHVFVRVLVQDSADKGVHHVYKGVPEDHPNRFPLLLHVIDIATLLHDCPIFT